MNRDEYRTHYDNHYKKMGESGAGQLVWEPQFEIWKKAGYKNQSVCDYGCGVGVMTEAGIKDYIGVDISKEAVEFARKRYPGKVFAVFKMGKLPPLDKEVCVAQSVFTHTPKIYVDECLQDIKRNFKDFGIADVMFGPDNPDDEHVRHFTQVEWEDHLWKNNFKYEILGEHNFVGYNHTYYKITHD